MSLDRYFKVQFLAHLQFLHTTPPPAQLRERFGDMGLFEDTDCVAALNQIPIEDQWQFLTCLYLHILIDQHTYAHFRDNYPGRQLQQIKFGYAGLGLHNRRPQYVLKSAIENAAGLSDALWDNREEIASFLIDKLGQLAKLLGIVETDYRCQLAEDQDFSADLGDPFLNRFLPFLKERLQ